MLYSRLAPTHLATRTNSLLLHGCRVCSLHRVRFSCSRFLSRSSTLTHPLAGLLKVRKREREREREDNPSRPTRRSGPCLSSPLSPRPRPRPAAPPPLLFFLLAFSSYPFRARAIVDALASLWKSRLSATPSTSPKRSNTASVGCPGEVRFPGKLVPSAVLPSIRRIGVVEVAAYTQRGPFVKSSQPDRITTPAGLANSTPLSPRSLLTAEHTSTYAPKRKPWPRCR
jgi:hypothetical protein